MRKTPLVLSKVTSFSSEVKKLSQPRSTRQLLRIDNFKKATYLLFCINFKFFSSVLRNSYNLVINKNNYVCKSRFPIFLNFHNIQFISVKLSNRVDENKICIKLVLRKSNIFSLFTHFNKFPILSYLKNLLDLSDFLNFTNVLYSISTLWSNAFLF